MLLVSAICHVLVVTVQRGFNASPSFQEATQLSRLIFIKGGAAKFNGLLLQRKL